MRARISRLRDAIRPLLQQGPITTSVVPRPRRPQAAAARLQLTHVVVSSDLNPRYLACWPLARRAWRAIADLEPMLVLVATETDVPKQLRADRNVRVFPPVDGLHPALQAQCVRLLYPALLEAGGVITADVDMVPLNATYFHRPAGRIGAHHFLAYRNALLAGHEIPICYNAARPETWGDVFRIQSLDDVRDRLLEWGTDVRYDGVRGGHGWDTDQVVLYETLIERGRRTRDVWILDDRFTGHRRLVLSPQEGHGPTLEIRRAIERGIYSDFHLLHPVAENAELNELIVELARTRTCRRARA